MNDLENLKYQITILERHLEILSTALLSGDGAHLDPTTGRKEYLPPDYGLCACDACRIARKYI